MSEQFTMSFPLISIYVLSILTVLFDAIWKNKKLNYIVSLAGIIITIIFSGFAINLSNFSNGNFDATTLLTGFQLGFGNYSSIFDILFCLGGLLTIIAAKPYLQREYREYNEFYSLIIFSLCGMLTISHSTNLLVLFVGIELMSVTFYIMAGFFRSRIKSVEASLKYFLLGAFATGFLILGIAYIYGSSGSLDLFIIKNKILIGEINNSYFLIGLGLVLIGLSFKIAAFPFHQWAPDVYHGSPTVVSAFMSSSGKAAAIAAFIIIAIYLLPSEFQHVNTFQNIIACISAVTMILGNITALAQKNIKRMLSYSSVAHAGYMLMGIAANNFEAYNGMIFYSAAYIFMQTGAMVVISILERDEDRNLNLEDYSGLSKSHPYLAAAMAVFMLSLAGIPPFAGFFGKYYLFIAAVKSGFTWLTIVAVISTIISMYYYIGLIIYMYFNDAIENLFDFKCDSAKYSVLISTFFVIILGLFPSILIGLTVNFFK